MWDPLEEQETYTASIFLRVRSLGAQWCSEDGFTHEMAQTMSFTQLAPRATR